MITLKAFNSTLWGLIIYILQTCYFSGRSTYLWPEGIWETIRNRKEGKCWNQCSHLKVTAVVKGCDAIRCKILFLEICLSRLTSVWGLDHWFWEYACGALIDRWYALWVLLVRLWNCIMLNCLHTGFVDKGNTVLSTSSLFFPLYLHHFQTHVNIQTHATRHT